jgi:hypothetical protein
VAVGSYTDDSALGLVIAVSESRGRWGKAAPIALPSNSGKNPGDIGELFGLSCGAAGSCAAVGGYATSADGTGAMAVTEAKGHWGQAVQISAPANGGTGDSEVALLYSVACLADGACTAVGLYDLGSGAREAMAVARPWPRIRSGMRAIHACIRCRKACAVTRLPVNVHPRNGAENGGYVNGSNQGLPCRRPHRYHRPVADEIRQIPTAELDGEADEAWERLTDDSDFLGVEATKLAGMPRWHVFVAVAEFLGEDPLESELRRRMAAALGGVAGAEHVAEEDREVWIVTGSPSGEALVRAAAEVVDDLAARARALVDS